MSYAGKGMLTSIVEHWNTPEKVLTPVRLLDPYGRGIGLDPCSNEHSKVGAHVSFVKEQDGLSFDWRGYGLVFMNAPYGKPLPVWTEKLWYEFRNASRYGSTDHAVSLVPARPDTRWWHAHCAPADLVLFFKGRLKFTIANELVFTEKKSALARAVDKKLKAKLRIRRADCVAPFPSALVYYGAYADRVRRILSPLGWIP